MSPIVDLIKLDRVFLKMQIKTRLIYGGLTLLQALMVVFLAILSVEQIIHYETNLTRFSNTWFLCICMVLVLLTGLGSSAKRVEDGCFLLYFCGALFCSMVDVVCFTMNSYELYRLLGTGNVSDTFYFYTDAPEGVSHKDRIFDHIDLELYALTTLFVLMITLCISMRASKLSLDECAYLDYIRHTYYYRLNRVDEPPKNLRRLSIVAASTSFDDWMDRQEKIVDTICHNLVRRSDVSLVKITLEEYLDWSQGKQLFQEDRMIEYEHFLELMREKYKSKFNQLVNLFEDCVVEPEFLLTNMYGDD